MARSVHRLVIRIVFVFAGAVIAAGIGTFTALLVSRPGKNLLARLVTEESNRLVLGSVAIGRIEGDFFHRLDLNSVVIRDTAGKVLAEVPRVELHYALRTLLGGQIVLDTVRLVQPAFAVEKHRGGRMNYQEIFRLNVGPKGEGPGTLFRIEYLEVEDGNLVVRIPWNPDGRLRTDRQKDSALAFERARPGRRIEPGTHEDDGLSIVRVISHVTARFREMRLSTPDHLPFHTQVDSLAGTVSDPQLAIKDFQGELLQQGDSLRFVIRRGRLPNTAVEGEGRIKWPRDTLLYDYRLTSPRVDLVDLRWVSPKFPALSGEGRLTAHSTSASRTEYDIRGLRLSGRQGRVSGRMVAILDIYQGLGFRDLALTLGRLDLDAVRPFVDTLPFHGFLTGQLAVDGFFQSMAVKTDLEFEDTDIPGIANNRFVLDGPMSFGGVEGIRFRNTRVVHSDLDMRTIKRFAPSARLTGRLLFDGTADGEWRNALFDGRAEHRDGDRPISLVTGRARLDARGAVLGVDAALKLERLSFEGIRGGFPTLPMLGEVHGNVTLLGYLDSLAVDGQVSGNIGDFRGSGILSSSDRGMAVKGFRVDFTSANAAALRGKGPASNLQGRLLTTIAWDSANRPVGDLDLRLGTGMIRDVPIDSATLRLGLENGMIVVDTAMLGWAGGALQGSGNLGLTGGKQGILNVTFLAASLAPFDSLITAFTGTRRREASDSLGGRMSATLVALGSLDSWTVTGTGRLDQGRYRGIRVDSGIATGKVSGTRTGITGLDVSVRADSIVRGSRGVRSVSASVRGDVGDLQWSVASQFGMGGNLEAAGRWRGKGDAVQVRVEAVALDLLGRRWNLERGGALGINTATSDTVLIGTADGSGRVSLAGILPGQTAGDFSISAFGIRLRELYALGNLDTSGVAGTVALDAKIGGTRSAPRFRGSTTVTGAVVRDLQAPLLAGVFDYENRELRSNLRLWRTGQQVLEVDAVFPLDLSFKAVERRQLPGQLKIRGRADSVELAVIEALTPNLRRVTGSFSLDAQVGGTWEEPRLGGTAAIKDAGATVPGLGVRYDQVNGQFRLAGDSIVTDSVIIRSGEGYAIASGGVRLLALTNPRLNIGFTGSQFPLIDVPDYLTLNGTGDVRLEGPIGHPVLTGSVRATRSTLFFADLLTKDVVNLEDPILAPYVDTAAFRKLRLESPFQSRFLDSLTIRDLKLRIEDLWLKSTEANVQLYGDITVNKDPRRTGRTPLRVNGILTAPRGTYQLHVGPIVKSFKVERGTVQYYNTPDLNAEIDLSARYIVSSGAGNAEGIPVIANITGTLLDPHLSLSTDADRLLSERDLFMLVLFGRVSNSVMAGSTQEFLGNQQAWFSLATAAFASELERALVSSPNAPFDLVEINPGFAQSTSFVSSGGSVTTLALGRQIGPRMFAVISLGSCLQRLEFSRQYLGASLEYRFHRDLKLQLAAEPVQACLSQVNAALVRPSRYQFGTDMKWDREY